MVLQTVHGAVSKTADALTFTDWLLQTTESTITLSGSLPLHLFSPQAQGRTANEPGAPTRAQPKQTAAPAPSESSPSAVPQEAKPAGLAPPASMLTLALRPFDVGELGRILGDPSLRGELTGEFTSAEIEDVLSITGQLAAPGEGILALDATLDPKHQPTRYQGSLSVRALDLTTLADKPGLESDLNLGLQVNGEGFEPANRNARFELALERSHLGAIRIDPSEIQLQADGERFEVQTFDLDTSILEANLAGEVDLAGQSNLSYALSLAPADLRELITAETLGGKIALTGQLQGEWPKLTTNGVLRGNDLVYEDARLNTFELQYQATDLGGEPQADARLQAASLSVGALSIEALSAHSTYAYENATHELQFGVKTVESSQLYANFQGSVTTNEKRQTLAIPELKVAVDDHAWHTTAPCRWCVRQTKFGCNRFA